MPEKRNQAKLRKPTDAGAVMLSEEELDEARGGGTLVRNAVEPSLVTVRHYDPDKKKE